MAQDRPLLGHMFFSSPDATRGQVIPIPVPENEHLDWLEDHGLGGCPVVSVYRGAKMMVTRRLGTNDSGWRDSVRDKEPTATIEELDEALTDYHRSRVLTPGDCPDGVWKAGCADRYIPGERPEKSIQSDLIVILRSWFRGVVRVEGEDKTNIGRIDVRLLTSQGERPLSYWIILELKVIKSFTHGAIAVSERSNVRAIVDGVKQAWAYRKNRKADEGMLEIYDLRQDKTRDLRDCEDVLTILTACSPPPRVDVWRMYGSAKDARDAGEAGV
jgi:hypothetical protein